MNVFNWSVEITVSFRSLMPFVQVRDWDYIVKCVQLTLCIDSEHFSNLTNVVIKFGSCNTIVILDLEF